MATIVWRRLGIVILAYIQHTLYSPFVREATVSKSWRDFSEAAARRVSGLSDLKLTTGMHFQGYEAMPLHALPHKRGHLGKMRSYTTQLRIRLSVSVSVPRGSETTMGSISSQTIPIISGRMTLRTGSF
jgi:hypothetical protein